MAERGAHTISEILSQPAVWGEAIKEFHTQSAPVQSLWAAHDFDRVIFSGCGSTYYLAWTAAVLFQTLTGIPSQAYPGSEIALLPDVVLTPHANPLLVTVSRSGETTETIEAMRVFRQRTGNPVLCITCYGDSQLAKAADVTLVIEAAQEQSLAQTRSFCSMLILAEAMIAMLAGQMEPLDALIPTINRLFADYHSLARQLGEDSSIEQFFFLGSGFLYGIAQEAMLKMKEMSISYSEAFHVLEFRHGPMSMVNAQSLIVGLISPEACQQEAAVLRQMHGQGAKVLAISEADYGLNLAAWSHFVHLQSGLPAWARPVVYLPVLQLMAYYRAMARGKNPDLPENLVPVIVLGDLQP